MAESQMDAATQAELAGLASDLASNPATRQEMLRLTKKIRPELAIPELEIETAVGAVREESRAQLEAMQKKINERELLDVLEKQRAKIRKKHKIESDEDVEAIENLMRERQIPDHETAADYWDMQRKLAAATPSQQVRSGRPQGVFDGVDMTAFIKNPKAAARADAYTAIEELRSGKVRL